MITHKYVISLEDSSRRKDFFAQKDAKDFDVFSAFDSRQGEGKMLYDLERFIKYHSRMPRGAEMGCAISHYRAIKKFLSTSGNEEDYLLVAEDDVRFSDDFEDVVSKIVSFKNVYDYIILSDAFGRAGYKGVINFPAYYSHLTLFSKVFFCRGQIYRLGQFTANPWGTGLYMISRKAAREFISFMESFEGGMWWLADDYDLFVDKMKIDFFHLKPALSYFDEKPDSINVSILENFSKTRFNLLDKNIFNVLKFIKLKTVLVLKSTKKFIIKNDW